jgi:hypothetical protein
MSEKALNTEGRFAPIRRDIHDDLGNGWVKLYRKSLDSRAWQNPHLWKLWCYCLLRANHKAGWVSVKTGRGQTEVYLEAGQFVFGRFSAAKDLRSNADATYKRLCKLKTLGNITTQNKTHFTVVTLCNWGFYQNAQPEITTQVTPKHHPSNTNKNDKNDKNDKKYIYSATDMELSQLLFRLIRKNKPDFTEPNLAAWAVEVRRLREIEKRTPEQIRAVIEYSQGDDFWWDKVLSTASLRKKSKTDGVKRIERIEMQMQRKTNESNKISRKFATDSKVGETIEA